MRSSAARWRRWFTTGFVLLIGLLVSGCVNNTEQTGIDKGNVPQDFLEPVGRFAIEEDALWDTVLIVALIIFVLVEALIVWAIFRYRERPGDEQLPKQVHGNPRLEALWTIIPAVILAIIAVPTVRTIFDLAGEPPDAMEVNVIGHQWWWEFTYPDHEGLVTANELHIPTGETILLRMTADDVIHSFWVPKLAGKQDVVPGRENLLKIETDEPGEYLGQCAEYCGLSHANMRVRVIAHEPGDFDAWAQQQAESIELAGLSGAAASGQQQFIDKGCAGCHSIRGMEEAPGGIGPDLTYFADRGWYAGAIFENDINEDAQSIRDWLADPPAMKPMMPQNGIGMPDLALTDQEIDELVEFLRVLKSPEQGE